MEAFSLAPGDLVAISIDATHPQEEPLIVHDGPIESSTWDPVGEPPGGVKGLPGNVLLSGRVWTGGPRVVIRYYYAQRDRENPLPICAVARRGGGELEGKPGKFPGSAELEYSRALAFVVRDFL